MPLTLTVSQLSGFRCVAMLVDLGRRKINELHSSVSDASWMSHHELNQTSMSHSSQFLTRNGRYKCGSNNTVTCAIRHVHS